MSRSRPSAFPELQVLSSSPDVKIKWMSINTHIETQIRTNTIYAYEEIM